MVLFNIQRYNSETIFVADTRQADRDQLCRKASAHIATKYTE